MASSSAAALAAEFETAKLMRECAEREVAERDAVDENGHPVMTHRAVASIVRECKGFIVPEVNDKLWLQNRRWKVVQGLEKFTGVGVLHLENNQIGPTLGPGLRHMTKLKLLNLSCNMIRTVDVNLAANAQLSLLNLATNQISSFTEGGLPASLNTLTLDSNCLDRAAAIAPLASLPNLEVLDLQRNKLDGEDLFPLFASFKALKVLYLQGNPIQRAPNYRRKLVSSCASLTYLDASPVEELEKTGAAAWARGGADAEISARRSFHEERRAAQRATTRRIAAERAARRAAASIGDDASGRRVLLPDAMRALATFVLDDAWASALSERDCPVCVQPLKAGERALPLDACGHVFHLACLKPWLTQASATCPLCRAAVVAPSGGVAAAETGEAAKAAAKAGEDADAARARTDGGGLSSDDIPGRWMRAPVSNFVLSMPSIGATPSPGGFCAGNDFTDGRSGGEGGRVDVDVDVDGDGDADRPERTITAGQRETNAIIQSHLRKRFSKLSSSRAAVEADQLYAEAMFARAKERRAEAREKAAAAAAAGADGEVATTTTTAAAREEAKARVAADVGETAGPVEPEPEPEPAAAAAEPEPEPEPEPATAATPSVDGTAAERIAFAAQLLARSAPASH